MATLRDEIPLRLRKVLKKGFAPCLKTIVWGVIVAFLLESFLNGDFESFTNVGYDRAQRVAWQLRLPIYGLMVAYIFRAMIYEFLYWWTYHYDIDDYNVIIKKGVIAQIQVTLPFNRITDVYVDQDMLDVALFLYDVHISTPTETSGELAHIDGLSKRDAQKLRRLILEKVNQERKEQMDAEA